MRDTVLCIHILGVNRCVVSRESVGNTHGVRMTVTGGCPFLKTTFIPKFHQKNYVLGELECQNT